MGTKVQANQFFTEFDPTRSLYHQNQFVKNGQNRDSIHGYDIVKVKQTILTHESIFRNQLQELHRLYGRQRELMNEIERRERNKDDKIINFFSNTHDTGTLTFPIIPLVESTSIDKNHRHSYNTEPRRFGEHYSFRDLCYGMAPAPLDSTLDPIKSVSAKKSKLFGVEISEGNVNGDNNENGPGKYIKKLDVIVRDPNLEESLNTNSEMTNKEVPNGGLPWFLKKMQHSNEPCKMANNSYFMNLDSLQNNSQDFFKKAEIFDGSFDKLKQKQDLNSEAKDLVLQKEVNNDASHSRHQIDLNISLEDENAPEMYLTEEENSRQMEDSCQECDRIAAEAIIDISSHANETTDDSCDLLKWFAETVSSQSRNEEESIINGRKCRGRKLPEGTIRKAVGTAFKLGEVALMGWGKRTRRMPRHRCANACVSFALKC